MINLIVGHLLCAWSWCRGSGVSAPPPIEHPHFSGCGTPLLYLAQYTNCISACGQLFTEWNEFSLVRHIAVLCEVVHQRHVTRLAALMLSACVLKQHCLNMDRAHYTPPQCVPQCLCQYDYRVYVLLWRHTASVTPTSPAFPIPLTHL